MNFRMTACDSQGNLLDELIYRSVSYGSVALLRFLVKSATWEPMVTRPIASASYIGYNSYVEWNAKAKLCTRVDTLSRWPSSQGN
jgi:hypothetical protein